MQTARGTSVAEPDAAPGRAAPRRVGTLVLTAMVVLALDQVSKAVVVATLSRRPPVRLLLGALQLEVVRNPGAAFGIAGGATVLFTAVAVGVVVAIVRTARRLYSIAWAAVLGLLLGGATGNLVDRLVRSPGPFRGRVVDWIDLRVWPVFNLADSAIVVGGILAVVLAMRGEPLGGPADPVEQPPRLAGAVDSGAVDSRAVDSRAGDAGPHEG